MLNRGLAHTIFEEKIAALCNKVLYPLNPANSNTIENNNIKNKILEFLSGNSVWEIMPLIKIISFTYFYIRGVNFLFPKKFRVLISRLTSRKN